ncbi:P-loop containing nucleoside triphosphate hydrolase protein [Mycena pura]|uniref:P-loop containing nucleoside triphosphate hydrolase protein n=1 Tax=Mycena pura TaxID=153505 RepID=A0AAD6VME0_9AGAR|nr:P-loop containing nucleoside triphosphate hydrolase protein [Mycena pura]
MDFTSSVPQNVPQIVMAYVRIPIGSRPQVHGLLVPACCTGLSACILLLQSLFALKSIHGLLERAGLVSKQAPKVSPGIGKGVILVYRVARLLGSLALLGVSISSVMDIVSGSREEFIWRVAMGTPYLYASILAFLSISPKHSRQRLIRHANFVLFVSFCVYVYRDIIPLATFNGTPMDRGEGKTLWTKIGLLFFTAVIIPLFTPRRYVPIDPENPMPVPNPEQTASIFSFAFYFFLDKIIFLAYRESQLPEDELYPLCDTDRSAHLKDRSFKYLDSFSGENALARRHIFLGLMRVFWREFTMLAFLLLLRVLANYSGPFAMNRLLEFIETRDQVDAHVVRPWVWILMIMFGPTRSLVRAEAIITQLVFAHSLRIRMKADADNSEAKDTKGDSPAVETPSSASAARSESDAGADTTDGSATPDNGESGSRSEDESTTVQASTASIKSATSNAKEPPKPSKEKEDPKKAQGSLVGKINNLVTTDLGNIVDNRDFLVLFIYVPFQIGVGIYFLYVLLGWSVWVGVASILLLAPVPGYMAKLVQSVQKERLKRTDERVQRVSEGARSIIKLFGWEEKMNDRIGEKRTSELVWIRKRRFIDLASNLIKYVVTMTTLIMGQSLTASKVFSSMTIFDFLRDNIAMITGWLNSLITGKVSLDRVNDFLKKTELLDAFDAKEAPVLFAPDPAEDERIGFRNATFTWSKETDGSLTRSHRQFTLKIDGEVLFERGRINLVIGPTGSGKTSLLMALLGEMHWIPSSPDSWYNLPRGSGVAYATQESWVLNETIRTNIIFDTPYDEERYKKVLYACALEQDMKLFQAGDQTEVGEKGLTLSGGQKARLTLARAAYSKASILLLDDVLAALDVHTAQWIVEKLFSGDLLQNRTVILVTHNVALTRPIADFIVTFGSDGRIQAQGSVSEITQRGSIAAQIREEQQLLDKTLQQVDGVDPGSKPADGKLILAEEMEMGHVSADALKMYLSSTGGKYPVLFFFFFYGGLIFSQIFVTLRTWMLGYWAKQYDYLPADEVDIVLWLDVTPVSRIIARVTNDVRAVDDTISSQFWFLSQMIISMMVRFCAIIIYAPVFVFPGFLVGAIGAWIGQIYIAGQLPVKRMMSNNRAPVLAHFGAAIAGLVSIRAFGAQAKFNSESLVRIDRYTRSARNYYNLNRWVSVRIDIFGAMFSAGLATYLLYVTHATAGDAGFLINMAVTFTQMLLWTVRFLNEFEVQGICLFLERIKGYINIEHEKPATEAGEPPAYWPASGDLHVEHLSARYSEDGPNVLHDISFHIKSGERVGIVGRTGSGKSSLTLSLLRCIPTDGSVRYDGIDTSKLNLDALRSSITIIPQVPELLSGTLRTNLDPFGQHDDVELNHALRAAGLFALQNEMDEGKITLDSSVSSGGSNLSVGQRQIFALARAIVRKSKILILDEVFSDYFEDSIIQNSLRQELGGDVSLITVAHRLQTIMDADKIVEFDRPKELLKIKHGKLRALVDESGDKDILYAMAGEN